MNIREINPRVTIKLMKTQILEHREETKTGALIIWINQLNKTCNWVSKEKRRKVGLMMNIRN